MEHQLAAGPLLYIDEVCEFPHFKYRPWIYVHETDYGPLLIASSPGSYQVRAPFRTKWMGRDLGFDNYEIYLKWTGMTQTTTALLLMGAGDAVSTVIRNTIRQMQTPDHIRGRMTSVNQIFFMGGPQLGEVEAGIVASLFGVPFAIVSGGIGCILGVFLIIWKWPELVAYNGDEHTLVPSPAD